MPRAFAQGSKRWSAYDTVSEHDKDRPDLREKWMMRGRTAPPGQSAAELRLRAHRQKMAMRDATAKNETLRSEKQRTGTDGSETIGSGQATPQSGTPWVALGPAPLLSNQNFYGLVSGRVTAVAIDQSDSTGNTVYVAGASGGVWKSTNAASPTASSVTWTALTDQQASLVNGAVSVKSDGSVVLVGTGEPDNAIDSYYGVGILRSTNHGANWNLIATATGSNPALSFAGLGFSKFAWDTSATSTVVAATGTTAKGFDEGNITQATSRGLYLSTDSGATWTYETPTDVGTAIAPISATDVVYNATAGLFIASIRYHGLYSSTNGTNWTRMTNQPTPLSTANCPPVASSTCPIYRGQLAVVQGRNEVYFWFVSFDQNGNVVDEGIWRSVNQGAWTKIDETGITNCGDPGNVGCGVDQGFYNLEIAAMPVPNGQATDLYAGAVNLFKCELLSNTDTSCSTIDSNFPNQWINLTHVYGCSSIASVHPDEHGVDFLNASGKAIMYFGNDGGVYRTLDGFSKLDSGTCGVANGFDDLNGTIGSMTQFVSFSLHPSDQNTLLGGTQDNGSPGTSTATTSPQWNTVNGGDGGYNAINPSSPLQWYTANNFVDIYVCDSGVNCTTDTFTQTVGPEEVAGDIGAFYTPYMLDPQNSSEMLLGTCRVWRGTPTVPPTAFSTLSVDFDTLTATTCTGDEINLVSGLAAGGITVSGSSNVVYATTEGTGPNAANPAGGEVWVTTDAATTEMGQVTGTINPSNYTISSLALDTSDLTGETAYVGIMGFLGSGTHIWQTTDAGASWSPFGSTADGLPDAPVNALLLDTQAHVIYAGTDVGVFATSTTSPDWTEVGSASLPGATGYLPNVPVSAIRIFNYDGTKKLRVSTYGRGIWEYALTTAPDYTNVILNTPQTVFGTQLATFNGTLSSVNGYASVVNLSCSGTPPSACILNPTQATPTLSGVTYTLTAGGSIGDYSFNAHAVGTDGQAITHDAPVTLHVVDFNLTTPSPDALSVVQGATSNSSTFQVTADGSFSGTVSLSCASGLPAGATCVFSPSSMVSPTAAAPVTITLTVTAATNTPVGGPNTVTISAITAGAPAAKTQTFALTVTAPVPDFTLAVNATPSSTVAGQNITWNGTLKAINGYNIQVSLSCVGAAPRTCSISPSSLVPTPSGATYTVTVGNSTAGAFSFSIQGTDGVLTHSEAVTLNVNTDVTWTDTGNGAVTVAAGQGASYSFSAAPLGGGTFSNAVSFSCSNLPALTSCSFNPTSIAAGSGATSVTLTIATAGPNTGTESRRGEPGTHDPARSLWPARANSLKGREFGLAAWICTIPLGGCLLTGVGRRQRRGRDLAARRWAALGCLMFVWLLVLVGCGGALAGGGGTQQVVVTISPLSALVAPNGQQQFSATVSNTSSQTVTWAVTGGQSNGTISANGLYTAPATVPNPSAVTVTATSAVVGSTPGSASVTIETPSVTVTVTPSSANVFANEAGNTWPASATQQQFTATVNNGTSQTVTWAVTGGSANGTIDATGLYTAPTAAPNPSTATVTATSTLTSVPGTAAVNIKTATAVGTYPNIQVTATAAGGSGHADTVSLTVD